jgi:hypothetical protein
MDTDTSIFIAILVVVVLGFAAIATWAVLQGTKPHLPNGTSYAIGIWKTVMHVDTTARAVAPFELDTILDAITETGKEWSRTAGSLKFEKSADPDKALSGMIVLMLGDGVFDRYRADAGLPIGVVAFQTNATQTFGSGPFMLVIKRSASGLGRLVVHETCHALCTASRASIDDNHNHKALAVWGPGGIEETASSRV